MKTVVLQVNGEIYAGQENAAYGDAAIALMTKYKPVVIISLAQAKETRGVPSEGLPEKQAQLHTDLFLDGFFEGVSTALFCLLDGRDSVSLLRKEGGP